MATINACSRPPHSGCSAATTSGQAERDARRRTPARARRRRDSASRARPAPRRRAPPARESTARRPATPSAVTPIVASASTCIDAPTAAKNRTKHGHRAALRLASCSTSPACAQHVLNDQAGREAGQQRLEVQRRAEAGDDRAQREQHDGDLAADVRGGTARTASRGARRTHRSEQRPGRGEPPASTRRPAPRVEDAARAICRQIAKHDDDEQSR